MGRRLRWVPEGIELVEVTCRTIQGRFLLRPSSELNRLIVGVLARSKALYPVQIHACVFMSNHYHMLLSVPDSKRLSQFMNYFQSNLALEAGRLHGWRAKFWGRRYSDIAVSGEERAQVDRLRYVLSHGVKEGLVPRPQDWPGLNSVTALLEGHLLEGLWIDRTRRHTASSREESSADSYTTQEEVQLDPLPCWAHLDPVEFRRKIRDLLASIARTYRAESSRASEQRLSLPRSPHHRPEKLKHGLAPWFHCASRRIRQEMRESYACFLAGYREAAAKLRRGDPSAKFPEGCFPTPLPYIA